VRSLFDEAFGAACNPWRQLGALAWWLFWVTAVTGIYVYVAFDTRADFLAVGALIALGWGTPQYRALTKHVTGRRWLVLVTVAALIVVASTLGRIRAFELSYPLKVLLIGLLIVQLLEGEGGSAWALLDRPVMRWLGTLSYSFYLYHYLIWVVVGWSVDGLVARGMLAAALTLPVAAASYYAIERPCLRLRERVRPAPTSPEQLKRRAGVSLGSAPA